MKAATTKNRIVARISPYSTANAPMPKRCIERDSGAMNVYSIVPSQRSHATVSVTNSKMIPRNAQMTAPTSRLVARVFSLAGGRWTARAMKTIVSVFAIVHTMNARSQRK